MAASAALASGRSARSRCWHDAELPKGAEASEMVGDVADLGGDGASLLASAGKTVGRVAGKVIRPLGMNAWQAVSRHGGGHDRQCCRDGWCCG